MFLINSLLLELGPILCSLSSIMSKKNINSLNIVVEIQEIIWIDFQIILYDRIWWNSWTKELYTC